MRSRTTHFGAAAWLCYGSGGDVCVWELLFLKYHVFILSSSNVF